MCRIAEHGRIQFSNLRSRIRDCICGEFELRSVGHCLRVDNLPPETARKLCVELRSTAGSSFQTYVLGSETVSVGSLSSDQLAIACELTIYHPRPRENYVSNCGARPDPVFKLTFSDQRLSLLGV